MKSSIKAPQKLKIELSCDPAVPLLGIYVKECKSGYNKDTCTLMIIAALFTIAKLWKQPSCPTTEDWIKKMWYLYIMEFYSATKKNEILSYAGKWMELENIIFSEVSQAQKAKAMCFLSYLEYRNKKNTRNVINIEIYREHVSKSETDRGDKRRRKR
jgi:hypothetical protein